MAKLLLFSIFVGLSLLLTCNATLYTVGDASGWDISTDLDSWTAGKNFKVGDVLLFQYSSIHSVNEVTKEAYGNCNANGAIRSGSGGNTSIPLATPGTKNFICGTLTHCLGGMKLQVNVAGAGAQETSPAGAPLPQDGLEPTPASFPRSPTNHNNPLPTDPSSALWCCARDSLLLAWFCVFWTLLWTVLI